MLFSGGVVKNKKLQRGNVFEFEDIIEDSKTKMPSKPKSNEPSPSQIVNAHESVYLLKWLFPETSQDECRKIAPKKFPKFSEQFSSVAGHSYWDQFEIVDDIDSQDDSDEEPKDVEMFDQEKHVEAEDEDMLHEIEDIDSDEDPDFLPEAEQQPPKQKSMVPGLALGGIP